MTPAWAGTSACYADFAGIVAWWSITTRDGRNPAPPPGQTELCSYGLQKTFGANVCNSTGNASGQMVSSSNDVPRRARFFRGVPSAAARSLQQPPAQRQTSFSVPWQQLRAEPLLHSTTVPNRTWAKLGFGFRLTRGQNVLIKWTAPAETGLDNYFLVSPLTAVPRVDTPWRQRHCRTQYCLRGLVYFFPGITNGPAH